MSAPAVPLIRTAAARDPLQGTPRTPLGVGVIGCGLIGRRRIEAASRHPGSAVRAVADRTQDLAAASAPGACVVARDWRAVIERPDVDIVVVSTPNALLADIACAALEAGRHVLMEKPMGCSVDQARRIAAAADAAGRVLHVGFNHRFHPAIRRAAALVHAGGVGRVVSVRARYGHGGRPGLEHEWRSDPAQAGGGELIDQGVHLADLIHWIAGMPVTAFGVLQTAVWPVEPLEDNAFALLRFASGAVAQLHVSMTQWKNLFSMEIFGDRGAVVVEGLGGSYGTETLTVMERAMAGGAPALHQQQFDGEDASWAEEWAAFLHRVHTGEGDDGLPRDGVAAMRIVDALYRSAASGAPVDV